MDDETRAVEEILPVLINNRPTIQDFLFKEYYLKMFVEGTASVPDDVLQGYIDRVAGGINFAVNIINDKDEVVAVAPAIADTAMLNNDAVVDTLLTDLSTADSYARNIPIQGTRAREKATQDAIARAENTPYQSEHLKGLLLYFGIVEKPEEIKDKTNGLDYDDLFSPE